MLEFAREMEIPFECHLPCWKLLSNCSSNPASWGFSFSVASGTCCSNWNSLSIVPNVPSENPFPPRSLHSKDVPTNFLKAKKKQSLVLEISNANCVTARPVNWKLMSTAFAKLARSLLSKWIRNVVGGNAKDVCRAPCKAIFTVATHVTIMANTLRGPIRQ